ncbi:sigma-70 family RNA polymerase sigma factor [Clostridium cylindrosporum DSM 605]|uniref:Sigma-70 family RNA polymerase sigma factor n=1 Tax=Clostridium cylindrosporum DSM 605 TaxID=1121307 RepID=A0A0J8G4B1_CLOCY|nr:sigma-70 family RNA polymerase sigma factor [Clostridium cylindrosporum DSM 605]
MVVKLIYYYLLFLIFDRYSKDINEVVSECLNIKKESYIERGLIMKISEENFINQLKMRNQKALDYILEQYGWIIKSIVKKRLYNLQSVQGECINDILIAV